MEMIVVRHGETGWNAEGRIQGHQDVLLNDRGIRQAEAVADRFKGTGVDAFYCSDLKRTQMTARPIAMGVESDLILDERLREWKLGVLERLLPEEAKTEQAEAFQVYEERDPAVVIPGGESMQQRFGRATECFAEIAERHTDGRVIVVTHGGIVDDLYRFVNGIALDADRDWPLYNCGVNTVSCESGEWGIVKWGEVGHLSGIGAMADWEKGS